MIDKNTDLRQYEPQGDWLSRLDAKYPVATTAFMTIFILLAMGLAGWADAPVA
ncbi:hypothetical protein [Cupriavidus necator]|jgi:hypothetical protein|uniref:hypothetical protein n=1 Tax=Cupriavidus necator TaxID=106590 RepID=UPI00149001CD|nr:hypothetical protein [Cupriavidus necator]